MKVFYLICDTKKRKDGDEILPHSIAGRYESMEELNKNRKDAIEYWAKCHDLRNCPIYVYTGEATI